MMATVGDLVWGVFALLGIGVALIAASMTIGTILILLAYPVQRWIDRRTR